MEGPTPGSTPPSRGFAARASEGLAVIAALLVVLWVVEIVDTFALDDRLQRNGIRPRRLNGLDGIIWAPFLHSNFAHLMSNTVPLAVLGALTLAHGRRALVIVLSFVALVGGGLTWLLGNPGNHIGASGVVFGLLGYLVGAAFFQRSLRTIVVGFVAVVLYGGMVFGFVPRSGVSWLGHLFGALAGLALARLLADRGTASEPQPGSP